jgi:hypothetical protein
MSVSYEELVCHLTTNGWTNSLTKTDFGEFDAPEVPANRFMTIHMTQTIESFKSRMKTDVTVIYVTDDKDALKRLTDKFGERPK